MLNDGWKQNEQIFEMRSSALFGM